MKQATVLLDYAEGCLQSTPMLRQLIEQRTKDTLVLKTGITLAVRSASFRRIRGMTCVAVLADECAFWMSDESANPDVEILNALRWWREATGRDQRIQKKRPQDARPEAVSPHPSRRTLKLKLRLL